MSRFTGNTNRHCGFKKDVWKMNTPNQVLEAVCVKISIFQWNATQVKPVYTYSGDGRGQHNLKMDIGEYKGKYKKGKCWYRKDLLNQTATG